MSLSEQDRKWQRQEKLLFEEIESLRDVKNRTTNVEERLKISEAIIRISDALEKIDIARKKYRYAVKRNRRKNRKKVTADDEIWPT